MSQLSAAGLESIQHPRGQRLSGKTARSVWSAWSLLPLSMTRDFRWREQAPRTPNAPRLSWQRGSLLFALLRPSSVKMRKALLAIIPATLLLPACSIPHASGKSGGLEPFASGQPYVRVQDANSNLVELQLAVRKFVPPHANGPAVWLAGVSHVGEPCYYAELQSRLNELTLV